MSNSFTNQVLAQIDLWENNYKIGVYTLSKKLDEEVALYMVSGFGGVITELSDEQADYINIDKQGPFKSDDYKY